MDSIEKCLFFNHNHLHELNSIDMVYVIVQHKT